MLREVHEGTQCQAHQRPLAYRLGQGRIYLVRPFVLAAITIVIPF